MSGISFPYLLFKRCFQSNKFQQVVIYLNTFNFVFKYYSYGRALQGSHSSFGKASSSDFWLDDVSCTGSEANIDYCNHGGWGNHNCGTSEAAKVICSSTVLVLLQYSCTV